MKLQQFNHCHALPTETTLSCANHHNDFREEFLMDDRCHQVLLQLELDFFLTDLLSIKMLWVKLSSLI
jgi:hypothetical protein